MYLYQRKESPFWQVRLTRSDGTYVRVSTNQTDKNKAETAAAELQVTLDEAEAPGGVTFKVAHDLFVLKADLKPNTVRSYTSSYRVFLQHLGDFTLSSLTKNIVREYVVNRAEKVSGAKIKRDLSYMSSMFNFWMAQPNGPTSNPVHELNLRQLNLRDAKKRTRWLTEEQFEHLLSHADAPTYRAILILAVETGMRKMEILGLTRGEVDLKRRRIVLGNLSGVRTKSSESRIIPLTPRAHQAVSDTLLTHRSSDHLFVGNRLGLPMDHLDWWPPLCRRAGLKNFRFHDLRHTFASWASQRGIEERVLQALLGHSTRSLTHRYSHLREGDLERAIQQFTSSTLTDTHGED